MNSSCPSGPTTSVAVHRDVPVGFDGPTDGRSRPTWGSHTPTRGRAQPRPSVAWLLDHDPARTDNRATVGRRRRGAVPGRNTWRTSQYPATATEVRNGAPPAFPSRLHTRETGRMDRYESTRATLRRSLVGRGRFTWVREPGSALAVACWPFSQVMHAYALSDPVSGPARFPGLTRGLNGYRDPKGGYRESVGRGKRYYDDNAWIGLAFLQRHAFSGGQHSRHRAVSVDEVVQGGLDPTTGGILWAEDGDTFNACSTGAGALLHAELGGNIDASLQLPVLAAQRRRLGPRPRSARWHHRAERLLLQPRTAHRSRSAGRGSASG